MAFSTDNIGKNCYINISENENIEDNLYGTIIGYYRNTDKNEEYYFVSINGEVKRIYDDSLINIVEDDSGSVTPGSLIVVSGEMTDEQAAQFRENIGAISTDDIGTIFVLKGSVATVEDLPTNGNHVGDVYYVETVSAGYIWLTSASQPNGYWEELGETFKIIVDSELSNTSENPVQNKVIYAALYQREKEAVYQQAEKDAETHFSRCPICHRWVCDDCFMVCADLDMCRRCAKKLNEKGSIVGIKNES